MYHYYIYLKFKNKDISHHYEVVETFTVFYQIYNSLECPHAIEKQVKVIRNFLAVFNIEAFYMMEMITVDSS